ncbi:ABC transporter substrate-binding protein [Rugosimonospora africana]|uniref:Sugar ABC transporter substrate-binding protein n=1 Tax=Rugosimonospora africana TaxID=556532 RepID=A0A8J3VUM6_9ACTN|nr:sugar ABC transporter substrate-binding protein [Rugosimonospora africana]GIH19737.1 sugar ABC transporter substrate-binding protein [Rugosimonospora africana]
MRKRRSVLAIALALAAGASLVACGGSGGSGGKQSVTMWIYPVIADDTKHHAFWNDTVKAFQTQNPNIDVKVEIFPWANRDQALATAIAGNKGPDVVYLIPDQLPKYVNNIQPVAQYLDSATKSDYYPNVTKSVTLDGKMLGAPILTSVQALMCDKKVFDAVGQTTYPSTWQDLLAMAPKFKAKGYDVTQYAGDLSNTLNLTFYPLLWQAGGDVFSSDGKSVAFDSDAGRSALDFAKQLVDGGYVDKTMLTAQPPIEQTRVAQNKVACVWNLAPQDVTKFWGAENIKILPPLKDAKQVQYGTVGSLVMLKGAKDKTAAGKWISYATSDTVMKDFDTKSSFFSPRKSTGSLYASDPVLGELEKYVGLTTVGPIQPKARDVMGVLAPEIQAALLGKKSSDQALRAAAKSAQPLLG